jgi:hypothetical protein
MQEEVCSACGGDGRLVNSFGSHARCPACHGSGRRMETTGFHDVTKTKPSHYQTAAKTEAAAKAQGPTTHEGTRLATEVRDSAACSEAEKAKLIREIMDHEAKHGQCTQTFLKKIRKQIRAKPA